MILTPRQRRPVAGEPVLDRSRPAQFEGPAIGSEIVPFPVSPCRSRPRGPGLAPNWTQFTVYRNQMGWAPPCRLFAEVSSLRLALYLASSSSRVGLSEIQWREKEMRRKLPMVLVRIIVGLVFLVEGTLKFMLPGELGAGRFAAIGLPYPHILAPLVGGIEIVGGAAVLLSLLAGDAALLLLCVIVTALIITKVPILLGQPLGQFALPKVAHYGWLGFLHEARTDLCMFFCLVAILIDSGLQIGRRRRWYQGG